MRILKTSELFFPGNPPLEIVEYSGKDRRGKSWYSVRAFVAEGNLCGDLEFYGETPISAADSHLKPVFDSFRLHLDYVPQFQDIFTYAQILYTHRDFRAAAPIFELALSILPEGKDDEMWRRVTTDQTGMAYGMSGNVLKARAIFEEAVKKDPEYPLYYYNLACADAEEGKLADARIHLQDAFARKANVIRGETLPDPTKDDSFLRHRKNKDFWAFVKSMH